MDGFMVNGQFLCKELAIAPIFGPIKKAIFSLNIKYNELNVKDKKTAAYVFHNVHGIKFQDYGCGEYDQDKIGQIIRSFTNEVQTPLIGYKGGIIEKKILEKMGIPCVNIEIYGCPKFNTLILDSRYNDIPDKSCNLHQKKYNYKGEIMHCVVVETAIFRNWYIKNILK